MFCVASGRLVVACVLCGCVVNVRFCCRPCRLRDRQTGMTIQHKTSTEALITLNLKTERVLLLVSKSAKSVEDGSTEGPGVSVIPDGSGGSEIKG